MIDVGLGSWAENYDGYVLLKFTSTYDFQQCFLDGKLFFNTADYFARCEERGRGDCNEVKTFVLNYSKPEYVSVNLELINGQHMLVVRDYSKNTEEYKPSTVYDYSEAKNRNRKVISFYTTYLNLEKQVVSSFPDNMADEFGKFGILITNRIEFFKRLKSAFDKMDHCLDAMMGFVEYKDLEAGLNEWHPFRKDKTLFGYQNEFRITFINDNQNEYMLNLGCSLRDIAVPIMAADVKKIEFRDGKLYYPEYKYSIFRKIYHKFKSIINKILISMKGLCSLKKV